MVNYFEGETLTSIMTPLLSFFSRKFINSPVIDKKCLAKGKFIYYQFPIITLSIRTPYLLTTYMCSMICKSLFHYLLMCLKYTWMSAQQCRPWSDSCILWHLNWVFTVYSGLSVPILLTLKMPKENLHLKMLSVYVVCWIFLQTFQTSFCIQANIVDPDQTAPRGAVWSGSTLFAKMTLPSVYISSTIIVVITSILLNI